MAFGASPAGGGLFGSPFGGASTPAFGAPPSTPAFGAAASTPAFSFAGQSTPAPASNLFGTTPAASPSPFGANPSPAGGLFGAPAAGGSLFGASSPAPASPWGATTSTFGAAASSPSLFGGAASSAAAPASSPFGNLFGGGTAPAASPGLFSGGTQMAPASLSNPALPAPAAAAAAAATANSAVKEIGDIKAAYTPNSPAYKFQYLLLSVVDNPAQRVKPPNVDELRWRQALAAAGGPDNPDRLWPVPANGFRDLIARSTAQAAALEENTARLKALQDLAFRLAKRQGGELKQRAAQVQSQHVQLAARLLKVCGTLDALESRLAASVGYRADVARAREERLSQGLAGVEAELAPGSLTGLTRRLDSVVAAAQIRSGQVTGPGPAQTKLDERSRSQLLGVLRDHAEGISKLQELLKRDALDIAIMRQEGGEEAGGRGGQSQRMLMD